jgi:peptidyl-dipeptidase Dcp
MKQPTSFIVAASIALAYATTAIPAVAASVSPAALDASNPFAKVSTLPFNYPAFD